MNGTPLPGATRASRPPGAGLPNTALAELAGIALLLRLAAELDVPWLHPATFASLLFLYVPMFRYRGGPWPPWAGRIREPRKAAGALLAAALLGAAAYFAWLALPLPPALRPGISPAPASPLNFLIHQFLVALTEELFFRGYLYDAFERCGRRPLLPTSFLFAATHLAVAPSAWRALTFFPALVFCRSREWTGTIWVPVALHFAFNLLPAYFGG